MIPKITARAFAGAVLALGLAVGAQAQGDAAIRKHLAERLPQLAHIDEVRQSEMPGVYEVRVGSDLYYTDAEGNFLIEGQMIDTRTRRNLTQERADKLTAIDFGALPIKDAFTIVRGNGKRKLAVFEDPNCPYCKRFEHDMQKVDNVTIYMFLYPILGPDSMDKARNIWCAKDKGRTWEDLMIGGKPVPQASCDTGAVVRNAEFGRKHKIAGTPTLVFPDGKRVPGAIPPEQVEKLLASVK